MQLVDILNKIEEQALSQRDKGAKFEKLIRNWFLSTPLYCDDIQKIWLWDEFPQRDQFGGSDSGIDLVILKNNTEYMAVQCKFYDQKSEISKSDVDTFISTSAKIFEVNNKKYKFAERIFISTTNKWSKKASELIENQDIPVSRISGNDLEDTGVDWDKLFNGKSGSSARKAPKKIRPHQQQALEAVNTYFKNHNRGKLIMACGTGKTFTSLKIAEQETNSNGLILFLVPSIALLGQTLREWSNDVSGSIHPICICSDAKITKKSDDDMSMSTVDLALPATTDIPKIIKQFEQLQNQSGLKVVFSTYQSIEVIAKAQQEILKQHPNFGTFDLIICDEAHRTTGVTLANEDESSFTKVHNNAFIKAHKRLYMTATPRLYDDNSKSKAQENNAYLCSMDDSNIYGEEIYRIGFGKAVEQGLLTDYKVLILSLNASQVPDEIQALISNGEIEFRLDDASKLMGCINGLSKQVLDKEGILKATDPEPMKRAVAFCQNIKASKQITSNLNKFSDTYINSLKPVVKAKMVEVSSKHIDGGMNALERETLLNWLKQDSEDPKECKILTNARCLSEGVDVPTLDAVLFLSAKNSQVDVVQSVGRVMRKAPNKKYGYIIIPVVIPADKNPEEALEDNKTYAVVWSVLNALRAHDDRFNAEINKIDLNKRKPKNILIGTVDNSGKEGKFREYNEIDNRQMSLDIGIDKLQNAIYAKMVEKVGDRKYLEQWAKEVAQIAERQIDIIKNLIKKDNSYQQAFDKFIQGLQSNISPDITTEQGIEMLSQHIITKPIFEALFEGYSFVENNPISKSMQAILDLLLKDQIEKETAELENFYNDVKLKIGNIDNAEGKQRIIVELYDKFFKIALPKLVEQLGIVYTPVEVVDFIIHSIEALLNQEFGRSLSDENVNILDPFTGTGTFISRLLQSGIIKPQDLARKYNSEIYANELVLLAYYIATVNIENIYHDLMQAQSLQAVDYIEFKGICLTDTFQLSEDDKQIPIENLAFKENSARVNQQKNTPLQIIFGNPPYSVGQKSENDNAKNKEYPNLDQRIANTYVLNSNTNNKRSLYDSYFRAFRWATDRLDHNGGIVGFVTNAGWLDSGAGSGFRKVIEQEFSAIYVFNLRGDQRTSGELSRKEGGQIFGSGSRTPTAITFLVKNPQQKTNKAKIYYHDIGDELKRETKLNRIKEFHSIKNINWQTLTPNLEGDWINQRSTKFQDYIPLIDKDNKLNKNTFFNLSTSGINSSRDSWVYSFSKEQLSQQMQATIKVYNEQLPKIEKAKQLNPKLNINDIPKITISDKTKISWSDTLKNYARRLLKSNFNISNIIKSTYRPFTIQYLYFDKIWNEGQYKCKYIKNNLSITTMGLGAKKEFSALINNLIPNKHYLESSNCYPLYYYSENSKDNLFNEAEQQDGITDYILNLARTKYANSSISKEDIFYYVYGFLHNPDYKRIFQADLKKVIPRLPLVEQYTDFKQYSDIGRKLADLHLNYENLYPLNEVVVTGLESNNFRVKEMSFDPKNEKHTIIYNSNITISNIPLEAYYYQVNGKSAIEWIMDRYQITTDKDSQITNDPNLWCDEHDNPKYILNLLLSIITLSVETNKLIAKLPKVDFEN